MRKPVDIFPKGKNTGKILAGIDRVDAANIFHHIRSHRHLFLNVKHVVETTSALTGRCSERKKRKKEEGSMKVPVSWDLSMA